MAFLVAGLVLVGVIAVLNLLLTMAVIRRLRRQEAMMSMPDMDSGPAIGSKLPAFSAEPVSGDVVTSDDLIGSPAILAFFSTDCSACKTSIPYLVEYAEVNNLKPRQVLVVVGGEDREKRDEIAAELNSVASVVYEAHHGPMAANFDVKALPTFVMIDDKGTVIRTVGASQPLVEKFA